MEWLRLRPFGRLPGQRGDEESGRTLQGRKMPKSERSKGLRKARLREEDARRAIHRDLSALKHYLDKLRDTSNACRELVAAASCPQSTGPVPRLGTAFKRYVDAIASRESILKISDDLIEQQRKLKDSQDQTVRLFQLSSTK